MTEFLIALLILNALLLLVIARAIYSVTKIFRKGDDMNRVSKTLAITLGGIIGARIARSLVRSLLK